MTCPARSSQEWRSSDMVMKLGEAGHDLLDEFLEHILERYRSAPST
jgi:hypothetical protein